MVNPSNARLIWMIHLLRFVREQTRTKNGDMKEVNQRFMLLCGSEGNDPKIQVLVQDETIWLSQKQMAELFEVSTATTNEHLKNIFKDEDLRETSVIRNFRIAANDGKKYNTKHYSLDAIIAVSHRVNSKQASYCFPHLGHKGSQGVHGQRLRLRQRTPYDGKDLDCSESCLSESGQFVQASNVYGCRSLKFLPSAASITTRAPWRHETFLPASNNLLVFFWRLVPQCLWKFFPIKS